MNEKCVRSVPGWPGRCQNNVRKVDGSPAKDGLCGTHSPEAAARRDARFRERVDRERRWDEKQQEDARRAAAYDGIKAERDRLRELLLKAQKHIPLTSELRPEVHAALGEK